MNALRVSAFRHRTRSRPRCRRANRLASPAERIAEDIDHSVEHVLPLLPCFREPSWSLAYGPLSSIRVGEHITLDEQPVRARTVQHQRLSWQLTRHGQAECMVRSASGVIGNACQSSAQRGAALLVSIRICEPPCGTEDSDASPADRTALPPSWERGTHGGRPGAAAYEPRFAGMQMLEELLLVAVIDRSHRATFEIERGAKSTSVRSAKISTRALARPQRRSVSIAFDSPGSGQTNFSSEVNPLQHLLCQRLPASKTPAFVTPVTATRRG